MQYYTKQQLQGSVKFGPTCLVGNWNEDVEIHNTKLRDFLAKKESGHLKLDEFQLRMSIALRDFELTKIKEDEFVHYGDLIQLGNVESGAVLCGDIKDKDTRPGERSCAVTATSSLTFPCARNTFLIARYKPKSMAVFDTYYDDILRFGQKLRLIANPAINDEPLDGVGGRRPLCLFSRPISTTHSAKYSRHQVVGLTYKVGYETVWEVRPTNPEEWIVSEGREVRPFEPITLVHCATKQALKLEEAGYPNDFGVEMEVSAHSVLSTAKRSVLVNSSEGKIRGSIDKPVSSPNHWAFVTGDKIETLPEPESSALLVQEVLNTLRSVICDSINGLAGLRKKLLMMDKDGSGSVVQEEFLIGLRSCGADVDETDLRSLMDFFAASNAHHINVRAFLHELEIMES
ncbi:hypothetical protein BSKO_08479 [Bryopsis sp. KO-2023]|nr:hypothetical protein BSKO_08479 [Bryopsis sp. KO-2023]